MKQILFQNTRTVIKVTKTEKTLEAGVIKYRILPDYEEEIYFETEIDLSLLHHMAQRAAKNRSGKSTCGALTVRVKERRRL